MQEGILCVLTEIADAIVALAIMLALIIIVQTTIVLIITVAVPGIRATVKQTIVSVYCPKGDLRALAAQAQISLIQALATSKIFADIFSRCRLFIYKAF